MRRRFAHRDTGRRERLLPGLLDRDEARSRDSDLAMFSDGVVLSWKVGWLTVGIAGLTDGNHFTRMYEERHSSTYGPEAHREVTKECKCLSLVLGLSSRFGHGAARIGQRIGTVRGT